MLDLSDSVGSDRRSRPEHDGPGAGRRRQAPRLRRAAYAVSGLDCGAAPGKGHLCRDGLKTLAKILVSKCTDTVREIEYWFSHMVGSGLTQDLAAFGVECSIERERAMPIVLKAVALGPPGAKRQYRVEAIEGLNRGLLIDTEHRGVLRWIDVEPDHISGLAF